MRTVVKWLGVGAIVISAGCPQAGSGDFTTYRDIPYASVSGVNHELLSLDIYTPAPRPPAPAPVLIWVHGGGWSTGDKSYHMEYKPGLFTGEGYCLVSINYRLSPRPFSDAPDRIKYPVHAEDVASAVSWVYEHIDEYGGDPSRIALMGHSAGAHLVSLVSTDESFLGAHGSPLGTLKGTIALDTEGYDIPARMGGEGRLEDTYVNAFGSDPEVWRQASPINHVETGKGIPPFLLVTRGLLERVQQCTNFAQKLEASGVEATVLDAVGYSHGDVNGQIGVPGETLVTLPILSFLKECFAPVR